MVGDQPSGLGGIFQGSIVGGSFIQVRDMVTDLPYSSGPGNFPEQDRQVHYRETSKAKGGWGLVVTNAVDRYGGVRV